MKILGFQGLLKRIFLTIPKYSLNSRKTIAPEGKKKQRRVKREMWRENTMVSLSETIKFSPGKPWVSILIFDKSFYIRKALINQKLGINIYTLLCIKQVNNKDLLYSTGNYIQYLLITYKEKNLKRIYICIYNYITSLYK